MTWANGHKEFQFPLFCNPKNEWEKDLHAKLFNYHKKKLNYSSCIPDNKIEKVVTYFLRVEFNDV